MARVTKTLWPPPIGAALTVYGDQGQVLVVLPYRGKLPLSRWLLQPVSSSDRARAEREVAALEVPEGE